MAATLADTVAIGTPFGIPPTCPQEQPLVPFNVSGNIAYTGNTATGKPSDNVFVEMFEWDIVKDAQIGANAVTTGSVAVAPNPPPGPWIVPLTAPSKGVGIKTYYKIRATPMFGKLPNAGANEPANSITWIQVTG